MTDKVRTWSKDFTVNLLGGVNCTLKVADLQVADLIFESQICGINASGESSIVYSFSIFSSYFYLFLDTQS